MSAKDFSYNAQLRHLTLRQLRSLAALSVKGSVTAASNHLGLTQPAVTQQLRQLQDLAGVPLLQRTGEGMLLTAAGKEVVALAGRIEAAIADCQGALDLLAGRTGGSVHLGAVSTAKYFVPHAIAAFSRRFPKIDIKLTIGNREEIRDAMHGYDLDFAVMGRPPADVDVDVRQLGKNPHVIIARKGHWLEKDSGLNLTDLVHETFLTREPGSGTRTLMEGLFQRSDLEPIIGMEMSSNETIKQAVMAGLGIALISAHTVAHELSEGRLVVLDVAGLPIVRQWYVIRRSDKVLLPPAQAMFDFLGSEGSNYLPDVAVG
ncbi:MAG: LysR family transcriptional regulator [Bradyrhizobium sp.]|uniref:LysR family transcriptional regulator n=1 Tax=Bradyrhizobium sp. TaxID=376 RepID=UPI0025BEECB0|nr:LysR family transcriptional regulator [Bradyrhizobium sp.]MBI5260606.1 LysR family transcriptional regulator [Bradyrhizobium sp.]